MLLQLLMTLKNLRRNLVELATVQVCQRKTSLRQVKLGYKRMPSQESAWKREIQNSVLQKDVPTAWPTIG